MGTAFPGQLNAKPRSGLMPAPALNHTPSIRMSGSFGDRFSDIIDRLRSMPPSPVQTQTTTTTPMRDLVEDRLTNLIVKLLDRVDVKKADVVPFANFKKDLG